MKKAKLLSYSKITAITSAMSALISQGSAEAGVVYFDVNVAGCCDLQIINPEVGNFKNINLDSETYDLSVGYSVESQGNSFSIKPQYGGFFDFSGDPIGVFADEGFYITPISRGTPISSAMIQGEFEFTSLGNVGFSYESEPEGPTFFALRLDAGSGNYNYGWVQILELGTTYIITGFAFEKDVNTMILAGDTGAAAVPEPGSLAVVSGLFGLMVAANRRARKRDEPSAPDALLNLASGARGVQKLREESAA
jgi:hypothetical protein